MHGVPADLDLHRFHGATLTQVVISEFQVQFVFISPQLIIGVEGAWEIRSVDGDIVDHSLPNDQRDSFKVHRLLARTIAASVVNTPQSFTITFDNGWSLSVFDSSREYESFSINPGDIYV